jgi:Uncharacterised nucleotidyltransferase
VIRCYASHSYFQLESTNENLSGLSRLPKSVKITAERPLNTKQYNQHDKKALTNLLQLIVTDAMTRDQTVDLDTNEELLRLIPVLCAYFSHQELMQLIGEKLTTRMLELNRLETAQNLVLERELQHMLHAFNEAHIAVLLFKGPALAYTCYLYLCWHYRFHGFTRLLWLYDLVVLLRSAGPELDWIELVQTARCQRLATTLYYCLSWCRDLFGVSIPAEVFVRLRPPWACRLVVERISMPNAVATLTSAQGQSRRIIAHRAMVDSTAALVKAGLQALFPSPASMGRRYMGNSRLPLLSILGGTII